MQSMLFKQNKNKNYQTIPFRPKQSFTKVTKNKSSLRRHTFHTIYIKSRDFHIHTSALVANLDMRVALFIISIDNDF